MRGALLITAALLVALVGCTPSLPPGTRICHGFPQEVCERYIAELELEGKQHGGVVAYQIVCTTGACTAASGNGRLAAVFADGTGRENNFGYAGPIGGPPDRAELPLPVRPICVGVPPGWCEEMARMGADPVDDWDSIRAITVLCTGSCSTSSGDGETRVRLADGSEQTLSNWSYQGDSGPNSH